MGYTTDPGEIQGQAGSRPTTSTEGYPPPAAPPATPPGSPPSAAADVAQYLDTSAVENQSALARLTDPSTFAGYTGTQLDHQSAALDALPDAGMPTSDNASTYVTVPVDKVMVSPGGMATATPTYATARGYKTTGKAQAAPPSPKRGN